MSRQATAAAAIRAELKANFASIKFSVRSESASMMTAVDIRWTDGATEAEVKAIVDKYQSYKREYRSDIPQAKFVSVQRELSEGAKAEFLKLVIAEENLPEDTKYNTFLSSRNTYVSQLVRTASFNHSFQIDGVYF